LRGSGLWPRKKRKKLVVGGWVCIKTRGRKKRGDPSTLLEKVGDLALLEKKANPLEKNGRRGRLIHVEKKGRRIESVKGKEPR